MLAVFQADQSDQVFDNRCKILISGAEADALFGKGPVKAALDKTAYCTRFVPESQTGMAIRVDAQGSRLRPFSSSARR
jgi:hypothetical protein